MSETGGRGPQLTDSPDAIACSFCAKTRAEVTKLIAGPKVYICDECIYLCADILTEELSAPRRERPPPPPDPPPARERLRELHDLAFRVAKGSRAEPGLPKVIGDVAMTLALALEPPEEPRDP